MTIQVQLLDDWWGENWSLLDPYMVAGTYSPQTSPVSALCWEKQCFPASVLFLILSPSETAPQVCDCCFSVCLHGGSFGCVLKMFFTDLGGTDYEQIKTPASNQLSPKTTFTKNILVFSANEWIKKTVVHLHNGIILSREKEEACTPCNSMVGTGEHYAKWNKPGGKGQIPYDLTFNWNIINNRKKQTKYNQSHWN